MLPRVKINFSNGALGTVAPSADCVAGLIVTASAVSDTFVLGNGYILHQVSDLATLGLNSTNNAFAYKHIKEFYDAAGDGAELWLMGVADSVKPSDAVDKENAYAKKLILLSNGRIRFIAVAHKPAAAYEAVIDDGLDSDVLVAAQKAQQLAEWATNSRYAPVFVLLAARGYAKENITGLTDLTTFNYNRVGIVLGDTVNESEGAAVALVAGQIAACSVHRHIGRVRDGSLPVISIYIDDEDPSVANVETLNDKGYITFRTFTGKSGYFISDDCLATAISDDYRSIARRRTIDKAYRIAYNTMLEFVNDEVPVTDDGYVSPAYAKGIESEVIASIANEMTAAGELGTDPSDTSDKGCKCYVNPKQNILATSKLNMVIQVKPYGYAKYIDIELGFITTNTEE